jgi:hypothetical protein
VIVRPAEPKVTRSNRVGHAIFFMRGSARDPFFIFVDEYHYGWTNLRGQARALHHTSTPNPGTSREVKMADAADIRPRIWGRILAAGSGTKAKTDIPKQFLPLNWEGQHRRTVLDLLLTTHQEHPAIDGITLVYPPSYIDLVTEIARDCPKKTARAGWSDAPSCSAMGSLTISIAPSRRQSSAQMGTGPTRTALRYIETQTRWTLRSYLLCGTLR